MKLNKVVEICEVCNSSDTLMFQSFVNDRSFRRPNFVVVCLLQWGTIN